MLASAGPASAQGKVPTPTDNLKVQVSINPANASPGDTVQKTIRLINEFDQPQNIVNFVDSLRSMGVGFVVNGSPTITPSPSCTGIGKGSMSAPNGGVTISITGGVIQANGYCEVVVPVQIPLTATPGTYTNRIPACSTTAYADGPLYTHHGNDYYCNKEPSSGGDVTVRNKADVGITKTDGVTEVVAGGTTTYQVVVSNAGPNAANNVAVTDTAGTGLSITSVACASTTGGAACTASNAAPLGTVNLPSGASATFTVSATVAPGATGSVTNTVTATVDPATTDDPNPSNNTARDTDTVTTQGTVSISKTVDKAIYANTGDTLGYTIKVSNAGPSTLTGVSMADVLPTGTTLSGTPSCTPAGNASCGTRSGTTYSGITLPPGGSLTITISAAVPNGTTGTLTNTATVSRPAGGMTCNPSSCAASVSSAPAGVPFLQLVKTASATTFAVGTPASYTLTVTNLGTAATSGSITVTDTVPAGLGISNLPTGSAGCTASGQTVTCTTAAALAASTGTASWTFTITPSAAAAPSVTNTASVAGGGDGSCPADSHCKSTVTTPVNAPKLQITKTGNGPWTIGQTGASYTLTVTNTGAVTTTGVVTVRDTLPTGITFGGTSPAGWTCTPSGQNLSCTGTPNLGAGNNTTLAVPVNVTAAAVPAGVHPSTPVTNVASVGGGGDPFNGGTAPTPGTACAVLDTATPGHCALVSTTVQSAASISTQKALAAGTITPLTAGQEVPYVIRITNVGGTAVTNYQFNEIIPVGTTLVSVTEDGTSTCTAGAAAGTVCPITVTSVPANGFARVTVMVKVVNPLPRSVTAVVNEILVPASCSVSSCEPPPTKPTGCPAGTGLLCVSTPTEGETPPPQGVQPIPTLSEWALALLGLAMLGGAWRGRQRHR
ncbi:MAG: IPTL-CTERM sorting domain-containing protein [Burkholderiales bacterium]|nr:IPTL-CTERM sorting domain-containing protein [Burkholderiales bacterium]